MCGSVRAKRGPIGGIGHAESSICFWGSEKIENYGQEALLRAVRRQDVDLHERAPEAIFRGIAGDLGIARGTLRHCLDARTVANAVGLAMAAAFLLCRLQSRHAGAGGACC